MTAYLLSLMFIISTYAAVPDSTHIREQSRHVGTVNLYQTKCYPDLKFSDYIDCLEQNGWIPGLKAAYLTLRGRNRFLKHHKKQGAKRCSQKFEEDENIRICTNRYVAHQAQMIGERSATANSHEFKPNSASSSVR